MAGGAVPAITLTDPQNKDSEPSPVSSRPQSPVKRAESVTSPELYHAGWRGVPFGPPGTATSEHEIGSSKPETLNRRPSTSGRLLRTNSNTASSTSRGPSTSSSPQRQDAAQPIDPLSQQILNRTNGAQLHPTSYNHRPATADGALVSDDARKQHASPNLQTPPNRTDTTETARKDLKKGVKAVSFLSRLIGNKKADTGDDHAIDDESVASDSRPEGMEAQVFTQSADNMEYNPKHPQPPAYIKVRSKFKAKRDFDKLFLAQELQCSKKRKLARVDSNKLRRKSSATPEQDTVWAMDFSRDGKYLAAAGADMVVRVWQVLSNAEERHRHEEAETGSRNGESSHAEHLSAPVFQSAPIREWEGHEATVLDLSWSKNSFLLSSSMDKTVRLWHVSRSECLCTFKHNDFVPSIAFHPKDDRFFLAGSLDSRLRLWSIPDKSVAFTAQAPNMITAVAFTPDGKSVMAGCLNGQCFFYDTEGMKYQTQIHVRSTRGQNARGSKITGIKTYLGSNGDVKLLITSNDSRVRIYNYRDKSLEYKFKGNENNSSQIRASLSDCGRYVVCGSEDRKAYLWSMSTSEGDKRDKRPVEMFEAHDNMTTCVAFAPTKTKLTLGKSEDPLYDLCNPPPVLLMSKADKTESVHSSRPPTENGSILHTPIETEYQRPKESAGYVARAVHRDGNVIVTADYSGNIKVFRQDCAWSKRRGDDWDRASVFSKRAGGASRNGSVGTKSSQRSLRDGRASHSSHVAPSERILSWRQGIASNSNVGSSEGSLRKGTSRSISPRKSLGQASRPESNLRSTINTGSNSPPSTAPTSLDVHDKTPTAAAAHSNEGSLNRPTVEFDSQEDIAKERDRDPMLIDESGRSNLFWDSARWKERIERAKLMHSDKHDHEADAHVENGPPAAEVDGGNGRLVGRPALSSMKSYVSRLSVERSSFGGSGEEQEKDDEDDEDDGEDDNFDDAREERPEDRMVCRRCGGLGFQARRVGEGVRLVCQGCGLNVS